MTIPIVYPAGVEERSGGFWLRTVNLWKGRRHFLRSDTSNQQRYRFKTDQGNQSGDLTDPAPVLLSSIAGNPAQEEFRFLILADTGQGTRSQYALVPLIRALNPDFMVINGDAAYPAGETEDFDVGFFRPYRGLDIPIWATMGNHEYYSKHYGQEFYDVFCRQVRRADWDAAGLRFLPQPGPYWEVRQFADGQSGLVVLGIDSGMNANLDGIGINSLANFNFSFDQKDYSDARQHDWLQRRLSQADNERSRVILIYHIPALVDQAHDQGTHLAGLHRAIASHPSVALVACGHVHNFQCYAVATFCQYVTETYKFMQPVSRPAYFVSGNAGAGLGGPVFDKHTYPATETSPTLEGWNGHVEAWKKAVGRLRIKENLLEIASKLFSSDYRRDAPVDADLGQYLSLLVVDVTREGATVTPAFLEDLKEVVRAHQMSPEDAEVLDIGNPTHRLTEDGVKACLQNRLRVVVR
jgi:predicted MPP superfamily phosphohydrolase